MLFLSHLLIYHKKVIVNTYCKYIDAHTEMLLYTAANAPSALGARRVQTTHFQITMHPHSNAGKPFSLCYKNLPNRQDHCTSSVNYGIGMTGISYSAPNLTLRLLMSYIYIYIYICMEHLFLMFLDHTQRRTTVGRTPLDE